MKAWKVGVLTLLVLLGAGLVFLKLKPSEGLGLSGPLTNTTARVPVALDLTNFYDSDSSFDAPGCWQAVPRGLQTLGNIPFRIEGLIQLWGEGPAGIGREYREGVEGIPVTGKFQTLYALHGASFTTTEGTPIAGVVFRYVDGTAATNSIHYGTDSRDWWEPMRESDPLPPDSPSKVVWRGDHPSLPDWVRTLRLFGTGIPNPKPEIQVKSVDLVSTKSRTTWVVFALTTGPSGLLKAAPEVERDEAAPEHVTVKLAVVDEETSRPVQDVRFQVTLFAGRRPRSYGFYTTDEQGETAIELPPGHIKKLSIEAAASDYPPYEISWNVEEAERIPTNYVLKVSKKAP